MNDEEQITPFGVIAILILMVIFIACMLTRIKVEDDMQKQVCHAITNNLEFYDKCKSATNENFIKLVKDKTNDR